MLLLSFVMLYQRRLGAVISAFAVQGALLAAAAAWQAYVQGAPGLYLTALIAFGPRRWPSPSRCASSSGGSASTARSRPRSASALRCWRRRLVGLSVLVVLPVTAGGATPLARVDLTIALSVVLLGMLAMIARRNAVSQVIGLLSLENGLILGAVGFAGMPLVVELSTAALVLMVALVAAVVVFQIRERLGHARTPPSSTRDGGATR